MFVFLLTSPGHGVRCWLLSSTHSAPYISLNIENNDHAFATNSLAMPDLPHFESVDALQAYIDKIVRCRCEVCDALLLHVTLLT
jgi:hypothetical protein